MVPLRIKTENIPGVSSRTSEALSHVVHFLALPARKFPVVETFRKQN